LPQLSLIPRRLLGAVLVAGVAALAPVSSAAAAPPPAPTPAPARESPAAHHHEHAKKEKHPKHEHDAKRSTAALSPSPSTTPTPSPSPSAEPAMLGPTAPAHPSPSAWRVLSGQTLGGLSYADPTPAPRRTRAPVAAVQGPPLAVTWPPHDRTEWPDVATSVRSVATHPTAPLLVGALIGLFLLVQNRIDRNDPKLVRGFREDIPDLKFGPVVR